MNVVPSVKASVERPTVSIVTVVYKDPDGLARTLASALPLPAGFELMVVDGGGPGELSSSPVSVDLPGVSFVEGRDDGPYDAMNRGIIASAGRWIWFVNAGDEVIWELTPLALVSRLEATTACWAAGDVLVSDGQRDVLKGVPSVAEILRGADTPCHQGVLVSREAVMSVGMFDLRYRISADYRMMCKLAVIGSPEVLGVPVARFYRGGLADASWRRREFENFRARRGLVGGVTPRAGYDFVRTLRRMARCA